MELLLLSFIAGVVTVLAPCVLPLLPVIIGSGVGENKRRPAIIIISFSISVIVVTLLLKRLVTQFGILPDTLIKISAVLLVVFGLFLFFPGLRNRLMQKSGVEIATQNAVNTPRQGVRGDVALGALLGPIFNSCSPTYAIVVATILPQSFIRGLVNMIAYVVGLGLMLALIAWGGRAVVKKMRPLADPSGRFKKVLGGILIILGIVLFFGRHKNAEARLVKHGYGVGATMREFNLLNTMRDNEKK